MVIVSNRGGAFWIFNFSGLFWSDQHDDSGKARHVSVQFIFKQGFFCVLRQHISTTAIIKLSLLHEVVNK